MVMEAAAMDAAKKKSDVLIVDTKKSSDVAIVRTKKTDISPLDLKEIQNVSRIAIVKEREMKDLVEEVGGMNFIKLFWDSKVPENKKWFFRRIAWKRSDPEAIQEEIKKYLNFYAEMKTVMQVARKGALGSDEDIDGKILELYENLREMAESARSGEKSTDSKTLCELHHKFVAEHEKIEYRIRRVESGALRQKQQVLTRKWEDALKTIENLTQTLERAEEEKKGMNAYLQETLVEQNEKWEDYRERMFEDNRKTMERLEKKDEEIEKLARQQEQLLTDNRKTLELLEKKDEEIEKFTRQQEQLLADNRKTLELLEKKEKQQEQLLAENREIKALLRQLIIDRT